MRLGTRSIALASSLCALAGASCGTVKLNPVQFNQLKDEILRALKDETPPEEPKLCADTNPECAKPEGCADNPQHMLTNTLKRSSGDGTTFAKAEALTVADLRKLQMAVNRRLHKLSQGRHLTAEERQQLQELKLKDGRKLSEGQVVKLAGWLVRAEESGRESVNCNIESPDSYDFHLTLVAKRPESFPDHDGEFDGVVVEMIPQGRQWDLESVQDVAHQTVQVMAVGPLFYDSSHYLRDDSNPSQTFGYLHGYASEGKMTKQPRRRSMWEIHPITEFYVCKKETAACDPQKRSDWTAL